MLKSKRSLWVGGLGGCLLCAASAASAQESTTNSAAPAVNSTTVIGPPQLRDFSLQPQERIVSQPSPAPQAPVELAPPPPTTRTAPPQPAPQAAARPPRTQPSRPAEIRTGPSAGEPTPVTSAPAAPAPTFEASPVAPPAAQPAEEAAETPAAKQADGGSYWLYAIPAAALAFLGVVLVRRRRVRVVEPVAEPAPVAAAPPKPRPEPVPRPWLELELKTDRASFTATEAVIQFELSVRNTGKSPARNLRIDVKMFNAGREQDQEIGAFFKTAGRDSTKLKLPGIGAESTGVIRGEVAMPRDEMRAVRLDDRLLFIPVVAVNVLYDWGEERTGQTSKSYVVGRELQEQSDNKMGAFRVDQGPRIWRTVGQRPHKLAKRV